MNGNESNIIGCATFGLDDIVSGSDGTIIKDHVFSLSCALLPGHPRGSIITGSNGFCGQILHPRRDPATSMFWSQLEWYWNPFSASKGEARAPS